MSSSKLTTEARARLVRWARQGLFVYLRPVDARLFNGPKAKGVEWVVSVENESHSSTERGSDLSDVIMAVAPPPPPKKGKKAWLDPKRR